MNSMDGTAAWPADRVRAWAAEWRRAEAELADAKDDAEPGSEAEHRAELEYFRAVDRIVRQQLQETYYVAGEFLAYLTFSGDGELQAVSRRLCRMLADLTEGSPWPHWSETHDG